MDIVKQVQAMSYVADEAANEIEWLRGEWRKVAIEIEQLRDELQRIIQIDRLEGQHGDGLGVHRRGGRRPR